METTKVKQEDTVDKFNEDSLKSTLLSTLIFVGGGIVIFIVLLFAFYMIRV